MRSPGVILDGLRYSSWWKKKSLWSTPAYWYTITTEMSRRKWYPRWSCPCLDGTLEGIAKELLAVFHETATEDKAEAFLRDQRVDGELDTDFGIGKVALHIGNIVGVESLEEVYLAFPVSLHGAVHDRLAFVVEVSDARELKGYGACGDITGSRAYEHFTGVQLMALWVK
ncbi:hypothetical protein DYB34_010024 [Aphanomyces astaci]|uniref:Uncharacterized protein n=1 Tax=Aphanomyces astaci TaxID=112090 RepID=A0A3R7AHC5_APHAT|nr:hypothetical protein DYB34_010024 [Aphanomyces astaci]